jgi:hypothetical protein
MRRLGVEVFYGTFSWCDGRVNEDRGALHF